MVMYAGLIHLADIKRPGHTIVGRKKTFTESTVATDVECRIQPASDVPAFSVLGRGVSEAYVGYFSAEADVQEGDKVVWKDRPLGGGEFQTFIVEGQTEPSSGAYQDVEHHIEVNMKRAKVE